jgi:phosphoribosylanthranilate isomerase
MAYVADRLVAERTRIKFCGLTRVVDVDAAVSLGADAVGFVGYDKSPRYVSAGALAQLAARVPAFITPVLLFVNASDDEIRGALEVVPHAVLQFQGDESAQRCRTFRRPYVRALRVLDASDWAAAEREYADAAALLADAPAPGYGGGGQVFDWTKLPNAAGRRVPLVLAGGLNVANVGSAIASVRPYAVDVSSAIEDAPGQKSARKMREFASAVFAAKLALGGP